MWSKRQQSAKRHSREEAYLLLDVVLAVAVFAIAMTGVVVAINRISETSSLYARDMQVQYGMDALLVEARHRPVEEMSFERSDAELGVVYRTEVEPYSQVNADGEALEGLYRLSVSATFEFGNQEEMDTAEVIVYRPDNERR